MKCLRHVLLVAVLWGVILAPSMVFATIYTDWWWNASQSGHGLNLNQQGNTLTAAWYTYDQTGAGMWLTFAAPLIGNTATGSLIRTTGPALGTPFNPNQVVRTIVGQGTFTFTDASHATFAYTVLGVSGTLSLIRFTIGPIPLNGGYLGGAVELYSGCLNPANNGTYAFSAGLVVSTIGTTIVIQEILSGGSCTVSGQYAQNGSKVSAQGTFTCTNGTGGTWSSNDVTVTEDAFVAKVTLQYTVGETCHVDGTVGGLKVQ